MNESLDKHYYLRFPHAPPVPRSNSWVTNSASHRPLLTFMKPWAAGASRSGENYKLTRKLAQSPVCECRGSKFCDLYFQSEACALHCICKFTGCFVRFISCLGRSDLRDWRKLGVMTLENWPGAYLERGRLEWRSWDAPQCVLWECNQWLECFEAQTQFVEIGAWVHVDWTNNILFNQCALTFSQFASMLRYVLIASWPLLSKQNSKAAVSHSVSVNCPLFFI